MWGLLISTIVTSAADCLNPIAITQQFVLQGMVKKPKHIWFFIIPTGITNLLSGFLAYFGSMGFVGDFFSMFIERHQRMVFTLELIVGIILLVAVCYLLQNTKIESLKRQIKALNSNVNQREDEAEIARKIKSVSPIALIALGVGATISELATALPYFAFLAILFSYELTLLQVTFILIVYNTIYTLPLMILYFVYIKAQDKFDRLYLIIKIQMTKLANIIVPTVAGALGVILIFHSISLLLK